MKTKFNLRLSGLWLLAVICFILLSPKWLFAPAAWLAPAALLLLMQNLKPAKSFLFGFLVLFVSGLIANYKVMPFPLVFFVIITLQVSALSIMPYFIYRLLSYRIRGWVTTLFFPCTAVTYEYLNSFQGAGTWGSIVYTQMDNFYLIQLASLTGIWGISFLLFWFASLSVWVIGQHFSWINVKRPVIIYASLMTGILFFGAMKSNPYFYTSQKTVRIAGITGSNLDLIKTMYEDAFDKRIDFDLEKLTQSSSELQEAQKGFVAFIENPGSPRFVKTHQRLASFQDSLFAKAKREAQAGARIISFSEALMFTVKRDEAKLLEKGKQFARENKVYLLLTLGTILPGKVEMGTKYMENKAVFISPEGEDVNTFFKNKPVPIVEGSVPGDGVVPVMRTSFGRVATSICYDADFPTLMRQAGEKHADILLLPSGDWKEISPYHAQMAMMRAVENGFSLFRTVSNAFSVACDFHGRTIASKNYFDKGDKVLIAYLPVKGIKTIYTVIGDSFAWMCVAGCIGFVGVVLYKQIELRLFRLFSRRNLAK